MKLQPTMLDADGNNIADLFGVNDSKKFGKHVALQFKSLIFFIKVMI
jgi:hypothetical protein